MTDICTECRIFTKIWNQIFKMIIFEKLETDFQSKVHPTKLYTIQLHTVLISSEPVSNFLSY